MHFWLSQSQVPQPESKGFALLESEKRHWPFFSSYPLKHVRQSPLSACEAHWSETGTQRLFALKTQPLEHFMHFWLSQPQVPQPESKGLALFESEKMHCPFLTSYPL